MAIKSLLKDGNITSVSGVSSFGQRIYLHAKATTDHSTNPCTIEQSLERLAFVCNWR